jgi:hypothetical protein
MKQVMQGTPPYGAYFFKDIPPKKLKNAAKSPKFALTMSDEETAICFYDQTVFGSGKEGFLLTDKRLYFNCPFYDNGAVDIMDITGMSYAVKDKNMQIVVNTASGTYNVNSYITADGTAQALFRSLEGIVNQLKELQQPKQPKQPKQKPKSDKSQPQQQKPKSDKAQQQKPKSDTPKFKFKGLIRALLGNIEKINEMLDSGGIDCEDISVFDCLNKIDEKLGEVAELCDSGDPVVGYLMGDNVSLAGLAEFIAGLEKLKGEK